MKLILDTNVFVSGIFFSGPPFKIIDYWRRGNVSLMISPDIIDGYQRISEKLSIQFPEVELEPWIELLMLKAKLIDAPPFLESVCEDPDDDKFLACAVASKANVIVSGDKHLLAVSGHQGITVLTPRTFVNIYF